MKRLWFCAFATLLGSVGQAHAMGALVGALAAAASAIGSTTIGAAIFSAGLSYGLNWLYQKFFGESNVQGVRQKLETGGDKPLSFLWGTTATAGKLVYFNEHGEDNDIENIWLTLVIALSDLPIHGLSNYLWVNGERCTIDFNETNPHGFHPVNEYDKWGSKYLWIKFYDGTQTQADPFLKSNYGNDPTRPFKDDMVGRGVAYAILICHFSAKGLWSGVPTFLFPAKGIKLYDLRKDSTAGGSGPQRWNDQSTWTWSDNLAVAKYNFIRGAKYDGKWVWGGQKVNAWRLPADNWIAAMNVCDQQIDKKGGGTVARYAGGGEISVNTPALGVINELDKCCSGHTTEIGGIFKTWVGPPGLSVFSFTDDDIVITEPQEDSLFKPLQETFNAANATYTEPDKGWAPKEAPARIWDDLVAADDGQVLVADLSFPFVSEKNQVQRLMREVIHDSRRQATHLLQLPPEAWLLDPYDVVTWNSARNGYVNKKFIVASIDDLPNCNQLVSLREVNASDYDWDVTYELDSEVGPISAVKPGTFNKPFSVEPGTIDDENGPRRAALTLLWDWTDIDMDVKAIQFIVRRKTTTKIIKRGRTDDPTDGIHQIVGQAILPNKIYQVRARAIPITPGRESDWSVWMDVTTPDIKFNTSDIGDGAVGDPQTDGTPPGTPTGVTLVQRTNLDDDGKVDLKVKVTWAAPAGASAKTSYEVYVSDGTDDFRLKSDDRVVRFEVRSGLTYTVKVRAISFNGTKGAWSAAATILTSKKATAPTAASGLSVASNHRRNKLKWTPCPDKDYKHTNIYRNTVNAFPAGAPYDKIHGSVFIDDDLDPGVTYHYWIAHQDKSGNEGAKDVVGNGAARKIADADTDDTAPAVPTGLTLVQTAKDVDEDGKVDIAIKATWAAAAGAKSYALKITQGTDVSHVQSDDLVHIFKAKSAKAYSVQVRSISFNGTKSALSNAVSLTPSKKSAAVVAPTSLTVKGNSKRNKLAWSESSEKDYKFTRIYRSTNSTWASAILLDKVAGTAFVDDDLKPGTTYYYYVAHVDQSGNASSVYPASTGAGISGTTNRSVDLTNIVANPDFVDGADGLDGWYPSTYQDAVSAFAPGASPPYAQAVYIPSRNAGFNELPWAGWSPTIPCNPGDVFYAECWVYSPATVDTQFRLTMRIGNSINTTYTHRTLVQDPTSGTWIKVSGKMTVPDTVGGYASSKVTIMVTNANTGTAVLGWYVTGVVFRRAVDAAIIVDGAVGNTALASGAVSEAKLASGRSSNLLLNTDARLGKEFFAKVWDANNDITFTIRNDGIWNPRGHPSFELYQPNASITSKCDILAVDISGVTDMEFPVIPGQRYEASAYFGSHRCTGEIIILFRKSNGSDASGSYWNSSGGSDIAKGGGVSLSGYQRLGVFAVAPVDAASAVIIVRKNPTIAGFGYTNSYLFFTRMFFAEAGPNQTEFSPWVNSGGSYVNSNMILAGAVDKAKFASGLSVPEVVAALPSSGNFAGRMAFLTTDNKLYRYTGGAWVATVAAVDVTGTLSDAQLSAISAIKVTGQLSDTQIASLTAAKLTGQITNTQISDNSISTPKLQAGAVTANEIAAGAITTSKLAVGSGANMIKNSDMRAGITGWGVENTSNVNLFTVTLRTDAYGPEPGALQIYQIDGTQSVFYGICPYANGTYEKYAVTPGKFYELSFYYLGHRCSYVAGHIQWIDAAGAHISYSGTGGIAGAQNTNPGKNLANFQRAWGVFQAPANAVSCRPFIRHGGTQSGRSDSYLFITRVYLGEANANQTEKTPWSPAGTTLIENGNIAASAVTADKIAANTITAAQIAANTITASKIATGTITATQIAANTITAAEIAANAVTANELAANAVIAGKIQAGAIGAAEIAANAVTADKLSVTNLAAISASLGNVDISLANIGTLTVGTINIANGAVTSDKTDQTTPSVPTGLTLVQTAKDVDEDGKVDIAIKATWNSAAKAKSYALKITQGLDVSYVQSDDLSHIFKAKSGKSYSVQVRSISFNGTKSALSAAVNLTPTKKAAPPAAAAGLTASTNRHKRVRLAWTPCPDKDYAHTEIWRGSVTGWANASLFAQVKGDSFIDDTAGNGAAYYYWIRHVDKSGNVGAYYPDAGNIAGATTNIITDDINTSAVTDQATSAASGGITVSGGSTTIQSVTSNHGAGAEAVLLIGQFKNNSNNTISATLSFTGDSQGTLYETGNINIGPKQLINAAYMYKNPSGTSSNFNFKVNSPDISFTASDRRLMAIGNKK